MKRRCLDKKICRARRGLTLAEVLVSISILSVFVISIPWTIHVAARAIPSADTVPWSAVLCARTLGQLAADLQYATSISTKSSNEIVFQVADRNGDAVGETVRYVWAGAGTSLIRQYNGGTSVEVLKNVQDIQLAYDTRLDQQRYLLTAVRCSLRTTVNINGTVSTAIRVLNEPQVSGP